jgi:hypothetical protein
MDGVASRAQEAHRQGWVKLSYRSGSAAARPQVWTGTSTWRRWVRAPAPIWGEALTRVQAQVLALSRDLSARGSTKLKLGCRPAAPHSSSRILRTAQGAALGAAERLGRFLEPIVRELSSKALDKLKTLARPRQRPGTSPEESRRPLSEEGFPRRLDRSKLLSHKAKWRA